MKLIEITMSSHPQVRSFVNVDYIISVLAPDGKTHITISGLDESVAVNETIEEIVAKINT